MDTTSTRAQLAAWLRDELDDKVTVIDHPTMPDDPADRITAIVLVVRQRVEPAAVLGTYLETHQIWVLDPAVDRALSEDQLDQSLDQVLRVIHGQQWIVFKDAERDTFADTYPAYRITVTLASTHTTEQEITP